MRRVGLALILLILLGRKAMPEDRALTAAEARELALKAFEASGSAKLKGFVVEQYRNSRDDHFLYFEGTWANPNGSVVVDHYAVDAITGDVWSAIVCREITSPALRKLQVALRVRIRLSEREYRGLRRQGPLC